MCTCLSFSLWLRFFFFFFYFINIPPIRERNVIMHVQMIMLCHTLYNNSSLSYQVC